MIYRKGSGEGDVEFFDGIPVVLEYKYLGITYGPGLNTKAHQDKLKQLAVDFGVFVRKLNTAKFSIQSMINIWKVYGRSIIDYNLVAKCVNKTTFRNIQSYYYKALKIAANVSPNVNPLRVCLFSKELCFEVLYIRHLAFLNR